MSKSRIISREIPAPKTLGRVHSIHTKKPKDGWPGKRCEIHIHKRYERALAGIEDYSHIHVVFWMHGITEYRPQEHPHFNPDYEKVGMLAMRCPWRPNPIGVSLCRLEKRKGNTLYLKDLDALDGSPVIDVKPYWPRFDDPNWNEKKPPKNVKVPGWARKLFRT